MNRLKSTIAVITCSMMLCSCNSINDDTTQLNEDITTIGDTSSDNSSDTESSNSVTTTEETTTTQETTASSSTTEDTTSTEDTTNDTSEETPSVDETSTEIIETYEELVIPITPTSDYITQEICKEISEYFNSMVNVDIDTFNSKQLSAYNSFMENYLTENDSNVAEMLTTYCDNFLKSSGDENAEYTDFNINNITLDYPNDVDSILNTMEYINQLDEVTLEYENYTLSDKLSAYYQLNYTIDYTLQGDTMEDFNSSKNGSILVLDVDGEIALIMLY